PPVSARHIKYLNIAADIVPIRYEVIFGGPGDLDIAVYGLLYDIFIMRADKESDIDIVSKRHIRNLFGRKGFAETGNRHNVTGALPLKLDQVGSLHRRSDFLGSCSRSASKLQ